MATFAWNVVLVLDAMIQTSIESHVFDATAPGASLGGVQGIRWLGMLAVSWILNYRKVRIVKV